jgi:tetratricopeptide (TPR) repeat protein
MLAFLKQREAGSLGGPPPATTEAASLPAPDLAPGSAPSTGAAGAKLQTLLLGAAEAAGDRRPIDALMLLREARALCQGEQLVPQEAAVLMAMGGTSVGAQVPDLGAQSYREAAGLAEALEDWPLACQAWLGVGGACLARADHASAAVGYRAAAAAAERAVIVPLRIEALRMTGACLLHLGRQEEASLAWKQALVAGSEADARAREASGLGEVAAALADLLERRGLHDEAQDVRRLEARATRGGEHHGP